MGEVWVRVAEFETIDMNDLVLIILESSNAIGALRHLFNFLECPGGT